MPAAIGRPPWIPPELEFDLETGVESFEREYEFSPAPPDQQLVEALRGLSDAAIIGYGLGCAEWVVYGLHSPPLPWATQQLTKFWALLNRESDDASLLDDPVCEDPAEQLVYQVLVAAHHTFVMADFGPPAQEAGFVHQHVTVVGAHRLQFSRWSTAVIGRLASAHPRGGPDLVVDRRLLGAE